MSGSKRKSEDREVDYLILTLINEDGLVWHHVRIDMDDWNNLSRSTNLTLNSFLDDDANEVHEKLKILDPDTGDICKPWSKITGRHVIDMQRNQFVNCIVITWIAWD